jgi:hypothetical protein
VVYLVEPIHRVPPKLSAPDISDIMDQAWTFLERTFKEVTPELEKAYMFFNYKAGRSTLNILSDLEELCRLTNKPVEGRAVVAKAINALRRELHGHLEREQLLWPASMLTLAHVSTRSLEIEEALRASELELAPLALAKAARGVQQLTVESKPRESAQVGEKRPRESQKERRQWEKSQEKGQAYAVMAPVAANKPAFSENCHNCGKPGHMKVNCAEKKPAGSGRKPGAVCNLCKKLDSHTEDDCWEKNPHMKPEKWRKRDAEAKPAYVAKTLEPSAPPAAEMEQPGFTAWTVATTTNCHREAFAVFADEGPELRPNTMEQRDTTPAARAKGEAERQAARAKEDQVRLGGPPPGFRSQGERRAEEVSEFPPAAPETGRRRGQPATAAPVAAARALPPGFREQAPGDPRYVGLAETEQSGVRVELLSAPVTGPMRGEVVQRRPPTAFMVDVEREDPDNPNPVEIERKAMLILFGAIAAKKGPREGGEDAGGPRTAAGVTPQVAHGGSKDAGGPEEAAGGTDQPSEKDGEGAGGEAAGAGGKNPRLEEDPTAEGSRNNTGAGEASAGGEGSDGEGSGDGSGDESGGDGDAEMAVDVEHATVELNGKRGVQKGPQVLGAAVEATGRGGCIH